MKKMILAVLFCLVARNTVAMEKPTAQQVSEWRECLRILADPVRAKNAYDRDCTGAFAELTALAHGEKEQFEGAAGQVLVEAGLLTADHRLPAAQAETVKDWYAVELFFGNIQASERKNN